MTALIIVVEDDEAVRDSTCSLLECYNYAVRSHTSAEDFLNQPRGGVDFLLLDNHLPGMTGLDLLERLRASGDITPALVITAHCDPTMLARAERIGVELLLKPVYEAHLISSIETMRGARAASDR